MGKFRLFTILSSKKKYLLLLIIVLFEQVIFLLGVCVVLSQSAAQCLSDNDDTMKVSEQRRQELLLSQLHFSADLLRTVSSFNSSENVFFSPTSVYNALLLAYFVSAKHTQDSLKEFLHIPKMQVLLLSSNHC